MRSSAKSTSSWTPFDFQTDFIYLSFNSERLQTRTISRGQILARMEHSPTITLRRAKIPFQGGRNREILPLLFEPIGYRRGESQYGDAPSRENFTVAAFGKDQVLLHYEGAFFIFQAAISQARKRFNSPISRYLLKPVIFVHPIMKRETKLTQFDVRSLGSIICRANARRAIIIPPDSQIDDRNCVQLDERKMDVDSCIRPLRDDL